MNKEKSAVSVRLLSFRLNPGAGAYFKQSRFRVRVFRQLADVLRSLYQGKSKIRLWICGQIKRPFRQKKADKTGTSAKL
jgi:hypothetical protein